MRGRIIGNCWNVKVAKEFYVKIKCLATYHKPLYSFWNYNVGFNHQSEQRLYMEHLMNMLMNKW